MSVDALLVGGSGFMGRHVARRLLAAGHRVAVLSRGRREPIAGVEALTADRMDAAAMDSALQGRRYDLTVDFGVFDAPDLAWLTRVPAASLGRFIMISTGQVYLVGTGAVAPYVESDASREPMPEPARGSNDHREWSYGMGKRRAESALRGLRSRGLASVALRLPIVQGEGDGSLRLWAWLERMLDGGPLVLPDGGRRPVRFLDVADLAEAIARIAVARALAHDAYNLAQPDVVSLRDFIERVARAAATDVRFVEASWEDCRAAGLEDSFLPYAGKWSSVMDPARAVAEMGIAGTPSRTHVPRIVHAHLEHRPARSHPGYVFRPRELELAARLMAAGR